MKGVLGFIVIVLMFSACGGRSMSAEEMQRKLDSIKKVEAAERLAAQGINLAESDNPLKQFYDSLNPPAVSARRWSGSGCTCAPCC